MSRYLNTSTSKVTFEKVMISASQAQTVRFAQNILTEQKPSSFLSSLLTFVSVALLQVFLNTRDRIENPRAIQVGTIGAEPRPLCQSKETNSETHAPRLVFKPQRT